tara:strand:+ start:319 stop:1137 length:819 start_codon:yes stop_codon:yes gene_type:complete
MTAAEPPASSDAVANAAPAATAVAPRLLLGWQLALSAAVSAVPLVQLAASSATLPPLLVLHVGAMAPTLPLGLAALSTIRSRKLRPARPPPDAAARKLRMERFVHAHFLTSAAALYVAVVGVAAIISNKVLLGRPHLRTPHAWAGAATLLLWTAAYLAAQPHVWRDQIRARRFTPLSNKRWLWADATHRRLGSAAVALSFVAHASGLLGWRALDVRLARLCTAALALLGASALSVQLRALARDVAKAPRVQRLVSVVTRTTPLAAAPQHPDV